MKILIVDNEIVLATVLVQSLKFLKHDVFFAKNGEEGIEIFFKEFFAMDIIIIDIMSDDFFDGAKVIEKIKKFSPQTKVVLMSRKDEKIGSDVDFFIKKPFDIEKLNEVIGFLS